MSIEHEQDQAARPEPEEPTITLVLDRAELTNAIARVLVERARGADRLHVLENQVVSRHIRDLLANLHLPSRLEALLRDTLKAAVDEKFAPFAGTVETVVHDAFNVPPGAKESAVGSIVRDRIGAHVREILYDNKRALMRELEKRVESLVGTLGKTP